MMTSRRDMIRQAAASALLTGLPVRMWGAARTMGEPDLRIGVLSDLHISLWPGMKTDPKAEMFRHALEYFRERNVDGVLVCGDLTDTGLQDEFELMAGIWNSVFPDGRGKDGNPVANLMHYGDHDAEARFYRREILEPRYARVGLPLSPSLSEGDLRKTLWEKCFGEEWMPIQHKKVKGYDFFLSHFMREAPGTAIGLNDILEKANLDLSRPFFYSQHRYVGGTYLSDEEMWGGDSGRQRPVLEKFPNVVSFSGHTHYMLTDDRIVWQEGFTQINAGALKDAPCGRQRENGVDISWYKNDYMRDTQMPCIDNGQGHGGMVFNLYGNNVVLERRDFGCNMPLGPDLVFSVAPKDRPRFAAAELKRRSTAPEFPANAKVSVSRGKGKNRRGESIEQISVSFPAAKKNGSRPRAFDYVVRATRNDGVVLKEKRVYSSGINLPPEKDVKEVRCVFAVSELAHGDVRFTVAPANCWRVEGSPISQSTKI